MEVAVREIIFDHLDKFYESAVRASKHYPGRGVHKDVVKELAARSLLPDDLNLPVDFVESFNRVMKGLYEQTEKKANGMGKVRATEFKGFVDMVKEAFKEGQGV